MPAEATQAINEYSPTEAALAELRGQYKGVIFEVATTKGDKAAREARQMFVKLRTSLEAKRKEIKAPALAYAKAIDSEAARITGEIRALEEPIDQQIKQEEERKAAEKAERERIEAERMNAIRAKVQAIKAMGTAGGAETSEQIAARLDTVQSLDIDASEYAELLGEALAAKMDAEASLQALHQAALEREEQARQIKAQQAALEQARREQEAREAKERAQREAEAKKLAEERAAFEREKAEAAAKERAARAEEARKLEAERQEIARQRAEFEAQQRAAEQAKQDAERDRLQAEGDARRAIELAKEQALEQERREAEAQKALLATEVEVVEAPTAKECPHHGFLYDAPQPSPCADCASEGRACTNETKDVEEARAQHFFLGAQAVAIFDKTGLDPRQLLEQRDELREALQELCDIVQGVIDDGVAPVGLIDGFTLQPARAAITKATGGAA